MRDMTIGRVAALSGVGVETVRYYERKGLIARPPRPASTGFRRYGHDIVRRIRFIRQAQALGFSLREIGDLLELRADPDTDCARVRARARQKLAEVEEKIARLRRIGTALEDVIGACPRHGSLRRCTIIAALESAPAGQA